MPPKRLVVVTPTNQMDSFLESTAKRGILVNGRYKVLRKLGQGSFGEIYLCLDPNGSQIALKTEPTRSKHPQLDYEVRVYKSLAGGVGIPYVLWCGVHGDYFCMAMDLLGASLEDLFNFCGRKFTLKTVLFLADQMVVYQVTVDCKNGICSFKELSSPGYKTRQFSYRSG